MGWWSMACGVGTNCTVRSVQLVSLRPSSGRLLWVGEKNSLVSVGLTVPVRGELMTMAGVPGECSMAGRIDCSSMLRCIRSSDRRSRRVGMVSESLALRKRGGRATPDAMRACVGPGDESGVGEDLPLLDATGRR